MIYSFVHRGRNTLCSTDAPVAIALNSQTKALTIGKLMEIVPAGTMDPTPFIYDSTMYTMAGLMVSSSTV